MTRTNKAISDLLMQNSMQAARAMEIEYNETFKLRILTCRILRESTKKSENYKFIMSGVGLAIKYFKDKTEFENQRRLIKNQIQQKKNSLNDAIKKIQNMNSKNLFKVIEMNMKYGHEKTISFVIRSIPIMKTQFNGVKLLIGEAKASKRERYSQ